MYKLYQKDTKQHLNKIIIIINQIFQEYQEYKQNIHIINHKLNQMRINHVKNPF